MTDPDSVEETSSTGRIGIQHVAQAAGVSATTVSHALNGRGKVSPVTRARVERIALELGYEANRIASALRRRRSDVLGFVSDEIASTPFAGRIVLGAQDAAAAAGMTLMMVNSNRRPEVERRQIEVLHAQQVDGLIYATMFHRPVAAPAPVAGRPVVLVNAVDEAAAVPSVAPDEYGVGVAATRLLVEAGHSRIAHLTIAVGGLGVDGRIAGYRAVMEAEGLHPHVVPVGATADAAAGRLALERALEQDPGVSAAFVFNDPMAMGVYQAAAARGRSVPGDLSVVSVDNLELIAGQLDPGLTTFELPHYEMGQWAVEQAVRRIQVPSLPLETVRMPCVVVVRRSLGAPR